MSNTSYPATAPANSAQAQVPSVAVGFVDAQGNWQPVTAANGLPTAGGGGGGGGAVTIADGADVTQGAIGDIAVAAGAAGTDSAKLRAISRDTGTVAANLPAKGQALMAASLPVAIASDQGPITVTGSVSTTAVTDATATGTINVQNGNATGVGTTGSFIGLSGLNGASTVVVQISGTWVGTIAVQGTNDGTNWFNVYVSPEITTSFAPAINLIASASVGAWTAPISGLAQIRAVLSAYTSGAAVVTLRASAATGQAGSLSVPQNLTHLGNTSLQVASASGGNFGAFMPTGVASSSAQTAYTAVSVVTSALTGLATITETGGIGTVCSFLCNLTAFAAGSSTGLDLFLQWSPDAGTNWINLWQVEAFTATGTAYIPPTYIPGRWRFAYQNRSGAATTATLTVTATRLNMAITALQRQFYDRTAAVLAGTPINSVTASYDVGGCKNIAASITTTSITTTGATYQLQTSADNVNWASVGTASATVTASSTVDISITNNTKRFARVIVAAAAAGTQVGSVIAITGTN